MPVSVTGYAQGPSCWDKVKMGFGIGFCVGLTTGAVLGGISAFRSGFRGRELFENIGKVMIQGGGTFGVFMAIGSGIRC